MCCYDDETYCLLTTRDRDEWYFELSAALTAPSVWQDSPRPAAAIPGTAVVTAIRYHLEGEKPVSVHLALDTNSGRELPFDALCWFIERVTQALAEDFTPTHDTNDEPPTSPNG
ncbi:hypothetical protein [Yinghuangia seranimata]|uniref:hypothetical protein n=1 Tax=Yinghuangia seranimata TaxID=408067 RepID=UPI00248CC225|nr:hypothetical protein [Yinghuangia seranimata]MDI2127618.1 hypothetical protein [Yinghuangia seranimata]